MVGHDNQGEILVADKPVDPGMAWYPAVEHIQLVADEGLQVSRLTVVVVYVSAVYSSRCSCKILLCFGNFHRFITFFLFYVGAMCENRDVNPCVGLPLFGTRIQVPPTSIHSFLQSRAPKATSRVLVHHTSSINTFMKLASIYHLDEAPHEMCC